MFSFAGFFQASEKKEENIHDLLTSLHLTAFDGALRGNLEYPDFLVFIKNMILADKINALIFPEDPGMDFVVNMTALVVIAYDMMFHLFSWNLDSQKQNFRKLHTEVDAKLMALKEKFDSLSKDDKQALAKLNLTNNNAPKYLCQGSQRFPILICHVLREINGQVVSQMQDFDYTRMHMDEIVNFIEINVQTNLEYREYLDQFEEEVTKRYSARNTPQVTH